MTTIDCDIAILGSGFGGTLLALIARRLGLSVALLERSAHPRFAIGESSTPLADFKVAAIADRFGLDWLRPFAKYGSWQPAYPNVRCGLKRGFSFFRHEAGKPFVPAVRNANLLLVAASPDDARGDTHWLRADFDAFLVERAIEAGAVYLDRFHTRAIHHDTGWRIDGVRPDGDVEIRADFTIDATGDAQALREVIALTPIDPSHLRARSRALYSHFTGVARWQDILEEAQGPSATAAHPFPCDAAAQHQIVGGGWMWVLRFDDGITSAGFSLDPDRHPIHPDETPAAEWQRLIASYPSLARQFRSATPVQPFTRTGRLQRRLTRAAGADWALLPHAAGFLDAWLSPGIAQTLFAVERLGRILADDWQSPRRERRLKAYSETVLSELAWMDEITAACFACFDRFEVMTTATMLYFVAAIYCEERERAGQAPPDAAFLLADDADYRALAADALTRAPHIRAEDAALFAADVGRALAAYNRAGLLDPGRRNLYPFTGTVDERPPHSARASP